MRWPVFGVVMLAWLAASAAAADGVACTNINTTTLTGTCGGQLYDLSSIDYRVNDESIPCACLLFSPSARSPHRQGAGPPTQIRFIALSPGGQFKFYLRVVDGGLPAGPAPGFEDCTWSEGATGNAVGRLEVQTHQCKSAGHITAQEWVLDAAADPPVLNVTFNSGNLQSSSTVVITCSHDPGNSGMTSLGASPPGSNHYVRRAWHHSCLA